MALNTIYATPSRSGGQPYIWIPFRETENGYYFALNGNISTESFLNLSTDRPKFFEDFRETLWVTESKHKKLADEIRNKTTKGYREFGSIAPFLERFEGIDDQGKRAPFFDLLSEADFRVFKKARVRGKPQRPVSELIRPGWLEPIWG